MAKSEKEKREANRKSVAKTRAKNGQPHAQKHTDKYRAAHPERYKAHNKVNNAGKDGGGHKCSKCGSTSNVDAHHGHGYAGKNATKVTYLCRTCHRGKK